ncbi:nitroreductase family deazaflavin-dependent oxidoreductase [Mycolicibacterium austroafricanum]|uniref:Nitroreductase family deazaflavin-dependent oxidoreductase n=1 Tax=Mycolicibacterium austroafricanum TaxID=39687 RepID=A0ABT8H7F3_MYCAO|nr:nitroreductase family deazaflavin-dependent oxidoreductase [Mycolicibacterium austroafricanum]MDN4516681.1 nitroreductase family deazaflavin-dependent oxidoreductase [Mycolicibacterium austroafricanum]
MSLPTPPRAGDTSRHRQSWPYHGHVVRPLGQLQRWMYRGNRPNGLARVLNAIAARLFAAQLFSRKRDVTLQVRGFRSGATVSVPVVIADHGGRRYLVSMLGENVNWVRNLRHARGRAVLKHRGTAEVVLTEVPPADRAPILKRYLAVAPGARPHFPISRHAPLGEFSAIAAQFPVFRIDSYTPGATDGTGR